MRETFAADMPAKTSATNIGATPKRQLDWRKRISDTVAYGLLAYTALQIFVTLRALEGEGASMLPMFALVVLVAGVIPLFRHYERRWEGLDDAAAADPALRGACRRDQLAILAVSIGLPLMLTVVFRAFVALA